MSRSRCAAIVFVCLLFAIPGSAEREGSEENGGALKAIRDIRKHDGDLENLEKEGAKIENGNGNASDAPEDAVEGSLLENSANFCIRNWAAGSRGYGSHATCLVKKGCKKMVEEIFLKDNAPCYIVAPKPGTRPYKDGGDAFITYGSITDTRKTIEVQQIAANGTVDVTKGRPKERATTPKEKEEECGAFIDIKPQMPFIFGAEDKQKEPKEGVIFYTKRPADSSQKSDCCLSFPAKVIGDMEDKCVAARGYDRYPYEEAQLKMQKNKNVKAKMETIVKTIKDYQKSIDYR